MLRGAPALPATLCSRTRRLSARHASVSGAPPLRALSRGMAPAAALRPAGTRAGRCSVLQVNATATVEAEAAVEGSSPVTDAEPFNWRKQWYPICFVKCVASLNAAATTTINYY